MENTRSLETRLSSIQVLVVGLAREGTALARFFAERGLEVTVTDVKTANLLGRAIKALEPWPIRYALGGHPLSILEGVGAVFVSPGVPLGIPLLAEARSRGIPISSETRLFSQLCPADVVGITGSNGKTTTTALVGEMLGATGKKAWVGGNIGSPLLGHLGEIKADDSVVMELSSFQLEFFGQREPTAGETAVMSRTAGPYFDAEGWSPHTAALLNITPNHLDRHASLQDYVRSKTNILRFQTASDTAIVGLDSQLAREAAVASVAEQRMLWFSTEQQLQEGSFLRGDELVIRVGGTERTICRTEELRLLGRHNVANVLAACLIAFVAGVPAEVLRRVASTFMGVEHRLELILSHKGVRWYNDSIATSPERTAAALRAFDAPIILLAGGRDKHLPWTEVASLSQQRAKHVILFGEAAGLIETALRESETRVQTPYVIESAGTLEQAVALADRVAGPGDVVLLSPGCTSFDSYADFEARGEHFRELVTALE